MKNKHYMSLIASLTAVASMAVAGEKQFVVADFGAIPDDGKDDRAAIQAAIDAAIAAGPGVTLEFEPGRYHLEGRDADKPGGYLLEIGGASGLTLRGNGAEWIVRAPRSGALRIRESDRVTLEGLVLDYDPLPFTVGRILEVDRPGDAMIVEALPGYPTPVDPMFDNVHGWGYFLDPDVPGKLGDRMPNVVFDEERTDLGSGRFRIRFKKGTGQRMEAVVPGVFYTRIVKVAQLFIAHDSTNLIFRDITSYASPSGHYVGTDLQNVLVENCRLLIREGRLKGGNADGVHFQNTRGPIIVQNSTFVGISDDGVNLYQKPHHILEQVDSRRLRISSVPGRPEQRPGSGAFRAGDRVTAFNDHTGAMSGPVEVIDFDRATGILCLAEPLDLPDDPGLLAQTGLYGDGFANRVRISGCTFADSRRFGVYLKSHDAVVENNHFLRLSASAIVAMNDTNHAEGLGTHRLLIENNRIEECGFSWNWETNPHWQAISIFAQLKPFRLASIPGFHQDVTIRNNTVLGTPRGFLLQSIDGLVVEENTFQPGRDQSPVGVPLDTEGSRIRLQ